jgi:ribosomal-protein-alanine N-acetyltransferase
MLATLESERLVLRPFEPGDAQSLHLAANVREIADTMVNLPHPYPLDLAHRWISYIRKCMEDGAAYEFAVTERASERLLGVAGLVSVDATHQNGELGYWIATSDWGKGFATEAAISVVHWAFDDLKLERVHARCLVRNTASVRVLEKAGFQLEGRFRHAVRKHGNYEDTLHWGVLRDDPIPR